MTVWFSDKCQGLFFRIMWFLSQVLSVAIVTLKEGYPAHALWDGNHVLLALSFLPEEDILGAFARIRDDCPREVLPIYCYFEDVYAREHPIVGRVKGRRPRSPQRHPPLFPPQLWSIHNLQRAGLARTNNDQEAWHRRFNTIVQRCHIGVYQTI